uniref:Uncharacterized protein n=1 Tax=Chromera velia CCMP2878 TaxID=1169474 RepID=A0A0G4FHU5_9ALVE|eukprot:Cvel_3339.t1-p1 / transcript=Cvel_3339.t1 / gene=Cvel_3339 / organism=Chromera_velia_CCMP2878 / gene_product=hypothetical protein / transcript_product=hypothetical protein / location=Cvel_scaffold133:31152-32099(+) / protein_length=316 / sequence_SO=supercontig / SO=protein_coding / is_pseudo=false
MFVFEGHDGWVIKIATAGIQPENQHLLSPFLEFWGKVLGAWRASQPFWSPVRFGGGNPPPLSEEGLQLIRQMDEHQFQRIRMQHETFGWQRFRLSGHDAEFSVLHVLHLLWVENGIGPERGQEMIRMLQELSVHLQDPPIGPFEISAFLRMNQTPRRSSVSFAQLESTCDRGNDTRSEGASEWSNSPESDTDLLPVALKPAPHREEGSQKVDEADERERMTPLDCQFSDSRGPLTELPALEKTAHREDRNQELGSHMSLTATGPRSLQKLSNRVPILPSGDTGSVSDECGDAPDREADAEEQLDDTARLSCSVSGF